MKIVWQVVIIVAGILIFLATAHLQVVLENLLCGPALGESISGHSGPGSGGSSIGGGGAGPHSIGMHGTPQYHAFAFCDPETGQGCQNTSLCPPNLDCGPDWSCTFHKLMCWLGIWH